MQKTMLTQLTKDHATLSHVEMTTKVMDPSLTQFDTLPDAAHVRLPAVLALFGISRADVAPVFQSPS